MTAQPVRPGEVSELIAWAARLSRAGLGGASPDETAAYLTAKASLLERIAATREQEAGPVVTSTPPAPPRTQPPSPSPED